MEVRDAKFEDLEALMPIAHEVHQSSMFAAHPMNEAQIQRNFVTAIAFDDGFAKVVEHNGKVVGCMAGVMMDNHFGIRCATDLFTFSRGGTDQLVRAYKAWAKSRGAVFFHITDLCEGKRYQNLLTGLGAHPAGINFIGVI